MSDDLIKRLEARIAGLTQERDFHRETADLHAARIEALEARLAATQPHIEAQREDAARRALEAAKDSQPLTDQDCIGAYERGHLLGVMDYAKAIRAIDPARFRGEG